MSNAQNSHRQSIILQSQPTEMVTNTQQNLAVAIPLQHISLQPPTTQIQIIESSIPSNEGDEKVSNELQPQVKQLEIINSVQMILNEISPYNMPSLIKRFKALPIDNMYCLEKTVDLIFEKAIEEQWFAPLCSSLCLAMQPLQVFSINGKKATFKNLIISKCQSLFELDKDQEMNSAKKFTRIHLCKDQEKKKELQLEFLENKRRLCKRSVGNCRFIGELFKQKFLPPIIMLLCVQNLSTKYAEVPLECLCNLLKTAGKELEQLYNLNDTFQKLEELTNTIIKPNISLRIKFMIQGIINLRRNRWIPMDVDNKSKSINYDKNDAIERQSMSPAYDKPEKRDHRGDLKFRVDENKSHREIEDLMNVDRNNTKSKQQKYTFDQSKLQSFKENTSEIALCPSKWSFSTDKNMTPTNDDKNSSNSPQIMSNNDKSIKPIISETEERQRMMLAVEKVTPRFAQPTPLIYSSSSQAKETVEEPVLELDSEVASKMNMKCKNLRYGNLENSDESSCVTTLLPPKRTRFTSCNSYAVLNDDEKSLNTSQIMSNNNTTKKPIISVTKESQRIMFGVATFMPQFSDLTPSFNFSETVKETVLELDSVVAYTIKMKCKNILFEFEELHNLDNIIYSLSQDESSLICTRHEEFVKSMSLITLDNNPTIRTTVVGKIFAELLSKKILSMGAITRGIDAVLKYWNDFLVDYPQFFSYIAAIIAPLLLSQNASFDFNSLKDSCSSIQPENSSKLFTEVLDKIYSCKEMHNIKEQLGSILWIYNKWRTSEYVPLDVFMPDNQLKKYLKNNLIGVFLLSIAMYDKMKLIDGKFLYDTMHSWISINISAEIIKRPQFVLALTIAIVFISLKLNHSYDDFFNHVHVKLLNCYIRFEPLQEPEIQARQVQCLYGIQLMSATLQHPEGMVLKLFHKLYEDGVISKESFELFLKEYEEIADL